jgi:hypothetical protein
MNFSVSKKFSHFESTDAEHRTENSPERFFGRSWARRHVFTFASFAKAATLRSGNGAGCVFITAAMN